jgi:hypothetical protein
LAHAMRAYTHCRASPSASAVVPEYAGIDVSNPAPSLPNSPAMAIGHSGGLMENANQSSQVQVSNWTLATGTQPGERHVYPAAHQKRRVRPRQNVAAAERRDSVPRVSARHARLHALPPSWRAACPAVLEDSRDRAVWLRFCHRRHGGRNLVSARFNNPSPSVDGGCRCSSGVRHRECALPSD